MFADPRPEFIRKLFQALLFRTESKQVLGLFNVRAEARSQCVLAKRPIERQQTLWSWGSQILEISEVVGDSAPRWFNLDRQLGRSQSIANHDGPSTQSAYQGQKQDQSAHNRYESDNREHHQGGEQGAGTPVP